jgi:outer membrane protein assembly factor BamB
MHKLRFILVGVGAVALPLTLAATASAQFDSPAPLAWRFLQPTKVPPGGAPVPNSNLVYQSIGGRVYCAYKDTGNLVWRYPQLDPIDGAFRTSPILAGGSLLATGDNSILYSIDPETGAAKWSQRIPAPSIGHPVVVGDAYVTAMSDNSLIALKVSDGTPLWSAPAGSTPGSSDASVYKVYDGIVGRVAASGDDVLYFTGKQTLVALNVARRAVDWQQSFDQLPPSPQVTVTREAIYLNSGPYLIALNPAKGTARWQVDTGMQLIETPVVSETGIMVLSQDGHAQVYDQLSHRPVMRNAKGEIATTSWYSPRTGRSTSSTPRSRRLSGCTLSNRSSKRSTVRVAAAWAAKREAAPELAGREPADRRDSAAAGAVVARARADLEASAATRGSRRKSRTFKLRLRRLWTARR